MKTPLNTLKQWFITAAKPTQAQFWNWLDSFWHKDEEIPVSNVENLENILINKADTSVTNNIQNQVNNRYTKTEVDNLLSQQGGGGNLMTFEHVGLTQDDIGKSVIVKNGKVQLPEFEPPIPMQPGIWRMKFNLEEFKPFAPTTLQLEFTGQPTDGDEIYIGGLGMGIKFGSTYDVQIGSTIKDTVENLRDYLVNQNVHLQSVELEIQDDVKLRLIRNSLDWYAYDYYIENLFVGTTISSGAITDSVFQGDVQMALDVHTRIGHVFVPILLYRYLFDVFSEGSDELPAGAEIALHYGIATSFTATSTIDGSMPIKIPKDMSELKAGTLELLNKLSETYEEFPFSFHFDQEGDLIIEVGDDLEELDNGWTFSVPGELSGYFDDAFDAPDEEESFFPGVGVHCKWKVIGNIVELENNVAKINVSNRQFFKSSYPINEEEFFASFGRTLVLDPDKPGEWMPITLVQDMTIADMFTFQQNGIITTFEYSVAGEEDKLATISYDAETAIKILMST